MVLIVSLIFLGLGITGVVFLEQEYDPNTFVPSDSYLQDYFSKYEEYFPEQGTDSGYLYLSKNRRQPLFFRYLVRYFTNLTFRSLLYFI